MEALMRLYLDTEFNGFGGELISMALVPADQSRSVFYTVVPWKQPTVPWVAEHVVPRLRCDPEPREKAGALLAAYLRNTHEPVIVADWPTDFEHLLALLISGPGMMQPAPDFTMEFQRLPGFNTANHSKVPHNALEDARALRDWCEGLRHNL
jgi:hypothetical protein